MEVGDRISMEGTSTECHVQTYLCAGNNEKPIIQNQAVLARSPCTVTDSGLLCPILSSSAGVEVWGRDIPPASRPGSSSRHTDELLEEQEGWVSGSCTATCFPETSGTFQSLQQKASPPRLAQAL